MQPASQANLRPWTRGTSGNPGGRPRNNLVSLSREATGQGERTVEFFRTLADGTIPPIYDEEGNMLLPAQRGEAPLGDRIRANEWLANRGYGTVETSSIASVLDTLRAMVAEMVAAIDDEPVPEEIALRLKERWREIIGRY